MSGYSYDWLRHLFKKETGYSLSQYILARRLEKAILLLMTTDSPVTKIASECHFSSASQFISYFKKNYQLTPLQYKKEKKEEYAVEYTDL